MACLGLLVLASTSGCIYSRYNTNTERSATEQLLIGESIRQVVEALELPDVQGRAVAVAIRAIPSKDTDYLKGVLEARLGRLGARIVAPDQAELEVTTLVGSIGTVYRNAAFGLPSLPIPSIGATPDIPFIRALRQRAWTLAQVVTRDRGGIQIAESPIVIRRARFNITSIFFIEIRSNDVFPGEGSLLSVE